MFAAEEIGFECSGFSASADAKTEVAFAESNSSGSGGSARSSGSFEEIEES